MKNLAKLNGAKALSKNEQKSVNGGGPCGYSCSRILPLGSWKCQSGKCVKSGS